MYIMPRVEKDGYGFQHLEVGQSQVYFEERNKLNCAIQSYMRRVPGTKFSCRRVFGGVYNEYEVTRTS